MSSAMDSAAPIAVLHMGEMPGLRDFIDASALGQRVLHGATAAELAENATKFAEKALLQSAGAGKEGCAPQSAEAVLAQVEFAYFSPLYVADGPRLLSLVEAIPNAHTFHMGSVGVDHVCGALNPLWGAREERMGRAMTLTNARGAFTAALAEWAATACLFWQRELPRYQQNKRDRSYERFAVRTLQGKHVVFVGWGDLAHHSAAKLSVFGVSMSAVKRSPQGAAADLVIDDLVQFRPGQVPVIGWEGNDGFEAELERELGRADYVIATLPNAANTVHFFDERRFSYMKESCVFVNFGRGSSVDEPVLCRLLKEDKLRGAALDVFEKEPLPEDAEIWTVPEHKLVLTPHNADLTDDFLARTWGLFERNLRTWAAGETTYSIDRFKMY